MFARKTVLVVGAGASREVNLPTGVELADKIASLLGFKFSFGTNIEEGDPRFVGALLRLFGNAINEHIQVIGQIAEGVRLVNSIDNYIDTHRHDSRIAVCGKAAIVYEILKAEAASNMRIDRTHGRPRMDFDTLGDTWYPAFGRLLVDQIPRAEVDNVFNNLAIICFNYDRCIEEFLAYWLASVYALELSQTRQLVDDLNILRPYGRIAPLGSIRMRGIDYGNDPSRLDFQSLINNIKTYTEQIEDDGLVAKIRFAMREAETVVFLGFAFHPQNLQLIMPDTGNRKAKRVFASAYGFSKTDSEGIAANLKTQLKAGRTTTIAVRNDLTCAGLFNEFRRTLST